MDPRKPTHCIEATDLRPRDAFILAKLLFSCSLVVMVAMNDDDQDVVDQLFVLRQVVLVVLCLDHL